MDALEREHGVVGAVGGPIEEVCDVRRVEPDPVVHPGVASVPARRLDRRSVDVVAVDRGVGVGHRDPDRRPAQPAADVGDPAACPQRSVDVGDRRQILPTQRSEEQRAVGARLALAGVGAVLPPADSAARAEGLQHEVDLLDEADRRAGERRDVPEVEHVGQRRDVPVRERVAALRRSGPLVGQQDAGHGLLLQPFAGVAFSRARAGGQLARRQRGADERAVVAEAVAEVHRLQVHRGEHRAEETLHQCGGLRVLAGGVEGVVEGVDRGHDDLLSGVVPQGVADEGGEACALRARAAVVGEHAAVSRRAAPSGRVPVVQGSGPPVGSGGCRRGR